MLNLAAIVGPTAVGKTSLALQVARNLGGEILSCDSMQIYRGMDIGTAKATNDERAIVPHHLLDIVEVGDDFSVADYQRLADDMIARLNQEGKLPILVGGTGLYYQAVVDHYTFHPMETQAQVRQRLQDQARSEGLACLYERLTIIDPDYAARISSQDEKRIIRALEVYELTGITFSEQQRKDMDTYNLAVVGLYLERADLYQRINKRVDDMLAQGLIEEVRLLHSQGYGLECNAMQALGYKQVLYYLDGLLSYEDMVDEIKRETRRYAKRQLTWFRRDKRINWFDVSASSEVELAQKISQFMEGQLFRA